MEYLCKTTSRGTQRLSTTQKAYFSLDFWHYYRALEDQQFQSSKDFKRSKRRRSKLKFSDKYWHGSNLRALCTELDKSSRSNKTSNDDNYKDFYKLLSTLAHPNSKETIHFSFDDVSSRFEPRPKIQFRAMKPIRRWSIALKTGRQKQIEDLIKQWKSTFLSDDYGPNHSELGS
jgi:hypothetical protein